jgi:hypothetical protein
MNYIFDMSGWYSGSTVEANTRSTTLVPPILDTNLVDGELRSNWTGYNWIELTYRTPVPQPEVVVPKRITKVAFRSRFTTAEKVAIELASIDNPASTLQARSLAAGLRVNMADQRDATYIDLSRADTMAGVQMLETFGLIGVGRASQILNDPIQEHEIPEVFTLQSRETR